jgi:hypothetical protein
MGLLSRTTGSAIVSGSRLSGLTGVCLVDFHVGYRHQVTTVFAATHFDYSRRGVVIISSSSSTSTRSAPLRRSKAVHIHGAFVSFSRKLFSFRYVLFLSKASSQSVCSLRLFLFVVSDALFA